MTTPRERLAALPSLSAGGHEHVDEGACFMEAVSYVSGEPWSDTPACACPVLGAFLRTWNDHLPTDADRDRLLRPLVLRLAGSRSTPEVEARRHWLAMDWLVRTHAPTWLRLTPALVPHADALTDLPPLADAQTRRGCQGRCRGCRGCCQGRCRGRCRAAVSARAAVRVAAGDAARAAAWDAARAALQPTGRCLRSTRPHAGGDSERITMIEGETIASGAHQTCPDCQGRCRGRCQGRATADDCHEIC